MLRTCLRQCLIAFALLLAMPAWAKTAPPLDAYGDLPALDHAVISASGEKLAFVSTIRGERWLLILDAGMNVVRSSKVEDIKLRGLEWIGDEAVLATSSETEALTMEFTADSYEAIRAMVVPADPDGEVSMVFTETRSIVDSIFGQYGIRKVGGKWTGFFGGVELKHGTIPGYYLPHTRPTLYAVRLSENSPKKADEPAFEGEWRDWLIDGDGKVAATFDMDRIKGDWRLSGTKGSIIAEGKQPNGDAGLVSLGKEGRTAIYSVSDEEGDSHLYEVPLDGSAPASEVFAEEPIEAMYIDKYTGRLLGYRERGEKPHPVFLDPEWQGRADKVARAFAKFDVSLEDWNSDFSRVIVRTSGTGNSGTWYLVDIAQLKASPIGYERPAIPAGEVGPVSTFAYKAQDGLALDGILTLPPGREAKNLPVVIFPHGGPAGHDMPQFDWWAQAFASRGYAVFQPNFRGSTNRDDAFIRAGYGEWGGKMQSDVSDGLTALAMAGIVDPSRACIMGASYGGYAALAGVTLQQDLYRCAVSVAGVADVELMYRTEYRESGQSGVLRRALIQQVGRKGDLDAISPRRFAAKADAPILLIHGRDDTVVAFEQSTRMADALKDAGKPYEFVELEGEDHWLSRADTRKRMLATALAFVQKHNPAD